MKRPATARALFLLLCACWCTSITACRHVPPATSESAAEAIDRHVSVDSRPTHTGPDPPHDQRVHVPHPEFDRVLVDCDIDCKVVSVRRNGDQVLAEIDAGSRDGIKKGWGMTIGSHGVFIARLRIVSVDINRATGIVELEGASDGGPVRVGQDVYGRVGR